MIHLQIDEKSSLNAWEKFFPTHDFDDYDEVYPHMARAIRTSKRARRYLDFMLKNLKAADEDLEKNGEEKWRLAASVRNTRFPDYKRPTFEVKAFNYLNQGDFDERNWPQEQFSAADIGFVRDTKQPFMLIGLITDLKIDIQSEQVIFELRVAGTYCLKIDFKG